MKGILAFNIILVLSAIFCASSCNSFDKNKNISEDVLSKPPFATLTDSINRFSDDALLYFKRAELLAQNNLHEFANNDYKKSWELKENAGTGLRYASNLSILGRENQAIRLLQDCIQKFPKEPEFKRLLSEAYIQSGKPKQAIELYDSVIKNDSSNFEAWYEKGILQEQAKDTSGAIASLKNAYTLQQVNTYGLELAHLYAEIKDETALLICDKVLQNDSSHELIDPFFIKGIYYSNIKNYESAINEFDSCIKRDWKFTDAYIEKGVAFFKQKNYDGALNTFRMAATVTNTDPDAYYWMGLRYEAINKKQQAAEYYQRAVELDKDFIEAKEALKRVDKSSS